MVSPRYHNSLLLYAWIWEWDGESPLGSRPVAIWKSDALHAISKTSSWSFFPSSALTRCSEPGEKVLAVRSMDLEKRALWSRRGSSSCHLFSGDVKGRKFCYVCLRDGGRKNWGQAVYSAGKNRSQPLGCELPAVQWPVPPCLQHPPGMCGSH